ncbi:MAG: SDR family NAD(P)-dependent oxidoreductase [Candidatus Aerophobetes bacterium]
MKLKNKIALVTGAGQGIGRGIALRLAQEGARVAVNDVNLKSAEETLSQIESKGGEGIAVEADVAKYDQVKEMARSISKELGTVDILVNNAGISRTIPFLETTEEIWDRIIEVNLKGTFLCCKSFISGMIKKKCGKIINISSESGKTGVKGQSAYCSSKFGVIGLTQSLALEFAPHKINVNAVCPGFVDTPLWDRMGREYCKVFDIQKEEVKDYHKKIYPLGRVGTVQDIASVILFLVSPESDWITGQSINVSGGSVFF